ncbi:MAG: phosphoribosylformylglycinamidine synthase subunit PurS [Candidatus Nezhaarchaeota archaeon]|nr:phosphoribosylformylglycinamidine synthase subunit PurS [Candidatus Nezhaarchaeota archaeon]MCX8141625.1 phosphoribosylformylglycinamidine synthase subunit PurS [Candidatus Nezhaarchaeota archaeon]MDW8049892.1 phosphoribosylformylglycinamidine synthase subunit PurS [Nitrososphaerota archaeon]
MKFKVHVEVKLKPGFFDPEGEATKEALNDLGYEVYDVRVSKVYTIELKASSIEEAKRLTDEMCRRLLANPTKDTYQVEVNPI